jgi:hypothetical protein
MSQNIDIQEIVNEITQPNAVCVIGNEVPENPNKRYLHILYSLMNIVKKCILKEVSSPYIHIKDVHGNFLFNDRIHIGGHIINLTAINNPGYCDIHLIKRNNSLSAYYYAATPDSLTDNNRFYMAQINFSNGILNSIAYEKAAIVILDMVKKGENMDSNTPVETSITVHNFEPDSKHWVIEYNQTNNW